MERYRNLVRRVRSDIKNGSKAVGKHKKGFSRHGQNFVKFRASGEENGQASDFGEYSNNEWNGLIAACGTVKEIRFEGGSLRILFALGTADNPSGDLKYTSRFLSRKERLVKVMKKQKKHYGMKLRR